MYKLIRYCILVFLLFLPAISVADEMEEAMSLYRLGDFSGALQKFRTLSKQGIPQSSYMLGRLHERGEGVELDEAEAVRYYRRAVKGGIEEAQQRLDLLSGGESSVVVDWYLETAWDGDVDSQFNLGYIYETGMGIRIDEVRAVQWYEEAANQQHAEAQFRLGMMLIVGAGGEQDIDAGEEWIASASANNHIAATAIRNNLLLSDESFNKVQIIGGLRTLEDSSPEKIRSLFNRSLKTIKELKDRPVQQPVSNVVRESANPDILPNRNVVDEQLKQSLAENTMSARVKTVENKSSDQSTRELEQLSERAGDEQSSVAVSEAGKGDILKAALANDNMENTLATWAMFSGGVIAIGLLLVKLFLRKRGNEVDDKLPKLDLPEKSVVPKLQVSSRDQEFIKELWTDEKKSPQKPKAVGSKQVAAAARRQPEKKAPTAFDGAKTKSISAKEIEQSSAVIKQKVVQKLPKKPQPESNSLKLSFDKVNSVQMISSQSLKQAQQIDKSVMLKTVRNRIDPFMEKLMFQALLPKQLDDLTFKSIELDHDIQKEIPATAKEVKAASKKLLISVEDIEKSSRDISTKLPADDGSYFSEQVKEMNSGENTSQRELAETRYNIGLMFAKGESSPRNNKLAIKWLQKAVKLGHLEAERELKKLYKENPELEKVEKLESLSAVRESKIKSAESIEMKSIALQRVNE